MNIVIGDYNINIKRNPVLNRLKSLEYYKEIPELFLETYTDLDYESIDEISKDFELSDMVIETVYKNLTINDETKFIKTTNNALELLNSIDGMLMLFLERYYECNIVELIKLTSEELLMLFIFNLRTKNSVVPIDLETLKNILKSFYSEKTVEDFIENCGERIKQQAQESFEKEMEQLNQI